MTTRTNIIQGITVIFNEVRLVMLLAVAFVACQSSDTGHTHGAADHGHELSEQITTWTDQTEVFVKFPALTAGKVSTFTVYVTHLDGHRPVTEGSLTINMIKDGKGIRQRVDNPMREGIFTPALQPSEPGAYQLVIDLSAPNLEERIEMGEVRVGENQDYTATTRDVGTVLIHFSKEQAWTIPFQTQAVKEQDIFEVVRTSGIWETAASSSATLSASATGMVRLHLDDLTEGKEVAKGQLLLTIDSKGLTTENLLLEIEKARVDFEQAEAEYLRKKPLFESRIIPKSEFEKVESRYRMARASYQTLQEGFTPGGKQVFAPFTGYIKSMGVLNGQFVEQGAALMTLGTDRSFVLRTYASPSHAGDLANIQNIWYRTTADQWSDLQGSNGSVQSVGKQVSRDQPMIEVFARVNEAVLLPPGSYTEVQIAIGAPRASLVVPESALLEDYGVYSVAVQRSGEEFELQPVVVGYRNGNLVEVERGLEAGQMVVTRGAYQVKMAALKGQGIGHGHVH